MNISTSSTGFNKLASSGVHPGVASARGYVTFDDPDQARGAIEAAGVEIPSNRWSGLALAKQAAATGDAMVMPWFAPGDDSRPSFIQLRPAQPLAVGEGKAAKYLMPKNTRVSLDVHPAIPRQWLGDSNVRLIVTEGLLKGDSIVSAMLDAGEVEVADDADREQLRQALESLPERYRCVPVSIVGVSTWRNAPGWESLTRADRDVYVAFDADLATNSAVWSQAQAMFEMIRASHGTPRLIDLTLLGRDGKDGVDDFFADGGHLLDLITDAAVEQLPDAPEGGDRKVGQAWMSQDETKCFIRKMSPTGQAYDEELVGVGGHIEALEFQHLPTPSEIEEGVVGGGELPALLKDAMVRLRLSHMSPDGQRQESVVRASRAILWQEPSQWVRERGFQAEGLVDMIPGWPPTKAWTDALREHTADVYGQAPMEVRAGCYGWIPGTSGRPVFALGKQVIGDNPTAKISKRDEGSIPLADKYGLTDPGSNWRDVGAKVLPDIIWHLLSSGAWSNRGIGAFVLAAGLRPIVALRPKTTLYFCGPPASGKSWTATKVMKFWAASPAHFDSRDTGGSANDTYASMENALARLPIWLADDLAPNMSRAKSESQQSAIGSIVRSVANGQGRSRMYSDMRARKTLNPRALLLITAENPVGVASEMSRMITLNFAKGSSLVTGPKEDIDALFDHTDAPMRATGALLRWVVEKMSAGEDGWAHYIEACHYWQDRVDELVSARLEEQGIAVGPATRLREMAKDVLSPLLMLRHACRDFGIADDERVADLFSQQVLDDALAIIVGVHEEQEENSSTKRFLGALATMLSTGQAYVRAADGNRPNTGENGKVVSLNLGWSPDGTGDLRPGGPCVGYFKPDKDGDDGVLVLSKPATFKAVQETYREAIPWGVRSKQLWQAVIDDGFVEPMGTFQRGSWNIRLTPDVKVSGVPIRLSRLQDLLNQS